MKKRQAHIFHVLWKNPREQVMAHVTENSPANAIPMAYSIGSQCGLYNTVGSQVTID